MKSELEEFDRKQSEVRSLIEEINSLNREGVTKLEFDSVSSLHKLLTDYDEVEQTKQKLETQIQESSS